MKHLVLSLLVVLPPALQAETNYCHDPATNKDWEQIMHSHHGERDVEALYSLRERLCREVDAGKISVKEATKQFEAERERVIRERLKYNRRQENAGTGMG